MNAEHARTLEDLTAAIGSLPAPPAEVGEVVRIVARPESGERLVLEVAELAEGGSIPGDRWPRQVLEKPGKYDQSAISVIRADLADLFAEGSDPVLAGDNLHVLLDLSEANLPVGSMLEVGAATVRVTPKAHTGCAKFSARFGLESLKATVLPTLRATRLRGLFFEVVRGGAVRVGDPIRVLSRGSGDLG